MRPAIHASSPGLWRLIGWAGFAFATTASGATCPPTPPDSLGPFYKSDAPARPSVGKGYALSGAVTSTEGCTPIAGARIELWLARPDGEYDDDHRATVVSGNQGKYEFESNFPPSYGSRPSHIHIRVTAEGFKTLVTQHYPTAGQRSGVFDLVLTPAR